MKTTQGRRWRRFLFFTVSAIAAAYSSSARAQSPSPKPLGIGRAATPEEIARIDIDVRPDGKGLPDGKGTVLEGAKVYAAKCQSCHGANGAGGSADRLVDRESGKNWDFATNAKLVKTVGNYWPYATTLYDYTNRAMPFMQPGTLTPPETYALVAYILNLNKIVPDDAVMDRTTLPKVVMPSKDRFVIDNRKGGKVVK
jgi:cytochrome c